VQASGGGGVGLLQTSRTASVRAYPVQVALQYEGSLFGITRYVLSGVIQHQTVTYEVEGSAYDGTNLLTGGSFGLNLLELKSSFLRLEGTYYPQSELTFTSETSARVNETTYKHSVLTVYTGSGAAEASLAYLIEVTDGQFDKYQRARWGFAFAYLTQPIDKMETTVATSNSNLSPRARDAGPVTYSYSLAAFRLLVAFAF
jgi:hypothetical protein